MLSQRYPVEYAYDAQGRISTMKTWRDYVNGSASTTTWTYYTNRNWLASKYDSNPGSSYQYYGSGRLYKKVTSRTASTNITKTYMYLLTGDLQSISYSDGTTPNVSFG